MCVKWVFLHLWTRLHRNARDEAEHDFLKNIILFQNIISVNKLECQFIPSNSNHLLPTSHGLPMKFSSGNARYSFYFKMNHSINDTEWADLALQSNRGLVGLSSPVTDPPSGSCLSWADPSISLIKISICPCGIDLLRQIKSALESAGPWGIWP